MGFFPEIIHGVAPWDGNRITLNFNFKQDVIDHFMETGDMFYHEYMHHKFPSHFEIKL